MPAAALHLDTNSLIYYVGGGDDEVIRHVEEWLNEGRSIHVSAMAWAEFQCGPLLPAENAAAQDFLHSVVPITLELAAEGGRLFHETGRRPRSLADCIIAATAIRERAALATSDRTDFEPFIPHGLQLL